MPAPLSTSADSPASLPPVGYTVDQLRDYIRRTLGEPIWGVELTNQHIIDSINDAVSFVSMYRPRILFQAVALSKSTHVYLDKALEDRHILGVVRCEFVDTTPAPTEIFYGNLISPAPIIRTGLDEYDLFLRWRKTWQRVTSVEANWLFDEARRCLYIYNPVERYHAGVEAHAIYSDTVPLPALEARWVKEYALAKAAYRYGNIMMKYGGAIPAPLKDLNFDAKKRDDAKEEVTKLEDQMKAMQLVVPFQID